MDWYNKIQFDAFSIQQSTFYSNTQILHNKKHLSSYRYRLRFHTERLFDQLVFRVVSVADENRHGTCSKINPFKDQVSLYNLSTCPRKEDDFNNLGLRNMLSEDRFHRSKTCFIKKQEIAYRPGVIM